MTLFVIPVTFVLALFVWQWPTPAQLFWLLLLGTFGTLAHLCLTQAFKEAEATAVVPIDFTRLIWASLLGYFLFGEVPDGFIWIGAAMIFGAVLFITYYEAREDRSAGASEGGEKA
jgi:drug/metabolite transporter (DMT)-like permease